MEKEDLMRMADDLVNRLAGDWQADAESKRRALNNVKGMTGDIVGYLEMVAERLSPTELGTMSRTDWTAVDGSFIMKWTMEQTGRESETLELVVRSNELSMSGRRYDLREGPEGALHDLQEMLRSFFAPPTANK
jgi:hypothetical protein